MVDKHRDLKQRTRRFALHVVRAVEGLPRDRVSDVLGKQLLRSGTSVAANYRSATRARSSADFIAKMGIVEEEADESAFWADLLEASNRIPREIARPMMEEAGELTAIAIASIRTARQTVSEPKTGVRRSAVPRSAVRVPRSR